MKTIMHVTEVLSGGVLPVIAGICNGLCDKYRFVVAYGIRFDTPQNLNEIFDSRIKLIPLQSLKFKVSIRGDFSAIKDIRDCIKEENPDILHIHSTKAGIDARVGLIGIGIIKYYTPHGFSFLRRDLSAIKRFILKSMEASLAKMCDGIIACGRNEFEEARKLTKKAFLIENGIDTDFIDAVLENGDEKEHEYTIYTAGRIGPQKNPLMFNRIAERLPNYKFVWIGEGSDRDKLTSKNIEVTGLLSRKEVIRRAFNYDCYLSTSLWEGLPIALMEAMYMGKKCVVSDTEGNSELISEGATGLLFRNIEEACMQIETGPNYGEVASKVIKDNYSLDKMCSKYKDIYG